MFGRPNFTAIILYAAHKAEMPMPEEKEILKSLLACYSDNANLNNILGLPFLIHLLSDEKEETQLEKLGERLKEKIEDDLLEYDDKAYLVSGLWKYHEDRNSLREMRPITESTIEKTPIMISDIINKGDISDITVRQDNAKISRLYKAVFLDLIISYKRHVWLSRTKSSTESTPKTQSLNGENLKHLHNTLRRDGYDWLLIEEHAEGGSVFLDVSTNRDFLGSPNIYKPLTPVNPLPERLQPGGNIFSLFFNHQEESDKR